MRSETFLVLVHHPTVDRDGRELTTAVTSLDLHDLARLARTYGLGGVYVTTPLEAQRSLVSRLLRHWTEGHGSEANPFRREALQGVRVVAELAGAVDDVGRSFATPPLLIATSARPGPGRLAMRQARELLAAEKRPALLLFGTGWGLAPVVLDRCEWVLAPIAPPSGYNHLSVRSAASIIVDRLFGE